MASDFEQYERLLKRAWKEAIIVGDKPKEPPQLFKNGFFMGLHFAVENITPKGVEFERGYNVVSTLKTMRSWIAQLCK